MDSVTKGHTLRETHTKRTASTAIKRNPAYKTGLFERNSNFLERQFIVAIRRFTPPEALHIRATTKDVFSRLRQRRDLYFHYAGTQRRSDFADGDRRYSGIFRSKPSKNGSKRVQLNPMAWNMLIQRIPDQIIIF